MEFRVVLVGNGIYKKTLHRCRTRKTAFINFNRIKESNKVFFPKKFINAGNIKPIFYQIYITKPTEPNDKFRVLRDKYGKFYTEKPLGNWTILHSDEFFIEEKFWIYGFDPKKERPDITEVIKRLMKGLGNKKLVKEIIVVHNKLIIYNEEQFEMILCKNLEDAQRLHHTLAKIAKKQKINNLMFMGTASKATIGRMYDLIKEKTNWKIEKIRRRSTRP